MTIITLLTLTASALANPVTLGYGDHGISETIRMDDDLAYVVYLRTGDKLVVDLRETTGTQVDYYLTNLTAYMAYKASAPGQGGLDFLYFLREGSKNSTLEISYSYTAYLDHSLVIVIDNTDFVGADSSSAVNIEGTISVNKNVWTWQNIAITALVICVIVAFMVGVKLPRK